ncbi:MAG: isochorismate synthase [Myxococcota bacterium]
MPRFGFARRDGTGLLGAGVADQVSGTSITDVLTRVQARGGVWFVGGSFDPLGERAPWWDPFGAAHAWRPRATFALPAPAQPSRVRASVSHDPAAPPTGRVPDRAQWQTLTDRAAAGIAAGHFDKVVLARTIAETTDTDALAWIRGPQSPREMAFLFEPQPGTAFAGLTPELLFDRVGTTVRSEALAGTDVNSPAGRERLLASDKDAREHALVVDAITRALTPLCDRLDPSGLELAVTGRLVHRLVAFEGRLTTPVSDARLAEQLHPTPAVAGTPSDRALAFLREHEPFDRGWYAGPIGLVESGRTTLSVALRCALWRGDTRITFAGAGWVPGSEAQAEWDETELKSLAVRRR